MTSGGEPTIAGGVARLLFVIGASVSVTATGRLAPFELVVAAGSFAYLPLIQFVALMLALRIVAPSTPRRRAFAFYLASHWPSLGALLVIAALVTLLPATLLFTVVPLVVLVALASGFFTTYRCLRTPLRIDHGRALAGTALHTIVQTSLVVAYFLGMGQLGPLVGPR